MKDKGFKFLYTGGDEDRGWALDVEVKEKVDVEKALNEAVKFPGFEIKCQSVKLAELWWV